MTPRVRPGAAAAFDSLLVEFCVDGRILSALSGQTVAGALHLAGVDVLRRNPVTGEPRGAFCGMGVCFECELTIDGVQHVRACMAHVRAGMRIETGGGLNGYAG